MQELHEDSHILFVLYTPRWFQSICTLWDVCRVTTFNIFTGSPHQIFLQPHPSEVLLYSYTNAKLHTLLITFKSLDSYQ